MSEFATTNLAAIALPARPQAAPASAQKVEESSFFDNLLDIVNPLQHIPVVSAIYRAITGDKIDMAEKIAGDTLYGGPLGFVSALADTAFKAATGEYFGDTVLAFFDDGVEETKLAAADAMDDWIATRAPAVLMPAAAEPATASFAAAYAAAARDRPVGLAVDAIY